MHRADFQKALASHLDTTKTRSYFAKRLAYYETPGSSDWGGREQIELHFEDGSSATCDVLIGADGIKSPTRRCLLKNIANNVAEPDPHRLREIPSSIDPVWSGSIAYRAVVPSKRLEMINPDHKVLKEGQLVSPPT